MRLAVIAVVAVAAGLAADLHSAGAVHNARWCVGNDCAFQTWDQCMATARGHARTCRENPRWRVARLSNIGRDRDNPPGAEFQTRGLDYDD
jgi:Protein of unknown function (DUF3551)